MPLEQARIPEQMYASVERLAKLSLAAVIGSLTSIGAPVAAAAPARAPSATQVAVEQATNDHSVVLAINGGALSTHNPTLHLAIAATGFDGTARMRFSLDGGATWTPSEMLAGHKDLPLPAKRRWGSVTVKAEASDSIARVAATASINYVASPFGTMALKSRYQLTADVDYDAGRIAVTETVVITNASRLVVGHLDFSVLAHAFGEMTVSRVRIDGIYASYSYTNPANLRVALGYNLRPDESAVATIEFVDTPSADSSDSQKNRLSLVDGLMQVSAWYPVLSDGHGLRSPGDSQFTASSNYRVTIRHPAGVVVAAPGTLVASSTTTKVYTLDNAREYAFAVDASFERATSTSASGVKVVVFHRPGALGIPKALASASAAIDTFSANLGPYPYSRIVVVQSTMAKTGQEYSGLVFVGSAFLRNADVIEHEIAHQWWYGIVGNDQLHDPWLDESFTEFTGHYFFNPDIPDYCSSRKVDSSVYDFPNLAAPVTRLDCDSYDQTIYYKGGWFLDGIRARMGTANFLVALRAMQSEYRFRVITTGAVRQTFMRYAPDPAGLDAYMDEFLR